MSCSNGKLKMGNVNAAMVCGVSCIWLFCADRSSYPKKKDGREKCSFREFDDRCLEGGETLPYFGKIVVSTQKSLLQKQHRRNRQQSVSSLWTGRRWLCFASFLQQDKALQLLQRKGLCPEVCAKIFILAIVQYFPSGSSFKLFNEFYHQCWDFGHII